MATVKRDYYEVLSVERTATNEELKRAYKKLAVQYHPDRNPGNTEAEERFKEATEAFQVLNDAEKRRRYDMFGHSANVGGGAGAQEVDIGAVADMLEGLFGEVFGGARKRAQRGRDVRYDLAISFEEAALGCDKTIQVPRPAPCGDCRGTGAAAGTNPEVCAACAGRGEVRYQRGFFAATRACATCNGTGKRIASPCATCHGQGTVAKVEELLVKVPPGVEPDSVRTVRGAGELGKAGAGDLHVYIRIQPHPIFTREGPDVLCTIPISFPQAVLGTQLDVPTLEGKVKMKIPPGTQSGKIFRLRGKGFPVFGGYGKGDELVKVIVEVPEKITDKQRKLLEQLAEEMGEESLPQQHSFLDKLRGLFG